MMYWPLVVGSSRVSETWWEVLLVQQAVLGWGCDDVMLFPSFLGIGYTLISAHWSAKYWRTHLEQILADTSLRLFQSTSFAGIIPKTHLYTNWVEPGKLSSDFLVTKYRGQTLHEAWLSLFCYKTNSRSKSRRTWRKCNRRCSSVDGRSCLWKVTILKHGFNISIQQSGTLGFYQSFRLLTNHPSHLHCELLSTIMSTASRTCNNWWNWRNRNGESPNWLVSL